MAAGSNQPSDTASLRDHNSIVLFHQSETQASPDVAAFGKALTAGSEASDGSQAQLSRIAQSLMGSPSSSFKYGESSGLSSESTALPHVTLVGFWDDKAKGDQKNRSQGTASQVRTAGSGNSKLLEMFGPTGNNGNGDQKPHIIESGPKLGTGDSANSTLFELQLHQPRQQSRERLNQRPPAQSPPEAEPKRERTVSTKDGLVISRNSDGTLKEVTGKEFKVYSKLDDGEGGTVERTKGDRQERIFSLVQSKNGRMDVADKGPDGKDRISTLMQDRSVAPDRRALIERAERHYKDDPKELATFKANIVRFESRAQERGLKPNQVTDSYKSIAKMLDGGSSKQLPEEDRRTLASQVMSNLANPTAIDQGNHYSCSVTALEVNIYSKDPEKAAELVSEVALNRSFKLENGTNVVIDDESLKPDFEAIVNPPRDGARGFASQVFQVTAVNSYYSSEKSLPWRYQQQDVRQADREHDTGERLRLWGVPHPLSFSSPGLTDWAIAKTHELITGRQDADVLLHNSARIQLFDHPGLSEFGSPEKLHDKLSQMQKNGKLPAVLLVYSGSEPFSEKDPVWHVVNVVGYDATAGEAKIDNQWGRKKDHIEHPVPVRQLFGATLDPKTLAEYQKKHGSR